LLAVAQVVALVVFQAVEVLVVIERLLELLAEAQVLKLPYPFLLPQTTPLLLGLAVLFRVQTLGVILVPIQFLAQ
jgi:hypothetical protein